MTIIAQVDQMRGYDSSDEAMAKSREVSANPSVRELADGTFLAMGDDQTDGTTSAWGADGHAFVRMDYGPNGYVATVVQL